METASEALCLLPVLKHWLQQSQLTAGEHGLACEAFLAVAGLIQLLSDGQQWHVTGRALLLTAAERILQGMVAAGWQDAMIPKCHWPLHIADCFGLLGYVPACFTVERKHKLVKRYATWQQNTTNFEYVCMKEVLADDLHKLTAPMVFVQGPALVAPVSPANSMRSFLAACLSCLETEVQTSMAAKLANGSCNKGDIVVLESPVTAPLAAEIWVFIETPTFLGCLVSCLDLAEYLPATNSASWTFAGRRALVELDQVVAPMYHCKMPNGIRTLLPWHWGKPCLHV